MSAGAELERLLSLMARLRSPDGCPWDREQTWRSLRPFILEEAYELVEAIDRDDSDSVREELGDLLLEVVFVNQIGEERGLFVMEEAIRSIHDKLVRRHPHVFQSERAHDAGEALERWEQIKEREKRGGGEGGSLLDGVPRSLPALARAQKISSRAARAGFDWRSPAEVREKLAEELQELDAAAAAGSSRAVEEELGDILFVLVNLARQLGVDAEVALSGASDKFQQRFRFLETELAARDRSVSDAAMEELESIWERAKKRIRRSDESRSTSPPTPRDEP